MKDMDMVQILRGNLKTIIDEIVREIDYDIWKDGYNYDTAEDSFVVEDNIQALEDIILSYAEGVY